VIIFILLLLVFPLILASSDSSKTVDSQIQKITHYAKEYEIGNVDYIQLMIHISSAREGLNEILGVTNKQMGGVVKQEQLKKVLGEPSEETKWVWVEGDNHDKKLDDPVPIWKKIIFDGKKIQIRMEAHPSIFKKKKTDQNKEEEFYPKGLEEGEIIYRLHFSTEFKKPQDQLNINEKIEEIKEAAEGFSKDPTNANAENLAKQSVNTERIFQNYFQQGQGNCEDMMISIFGSENQRQTQKIISNEFVFSEGENFEAMMRLEMCDECQWNWINLNMWIEGRGKFNQPKEESFDKEQDKNKFKKLTDLEFRTEIKKIIEEMKQKIESGDFNKALQISRTLNMLNNAWSENSNNVWDTVKEESESKIKSMSEEERHEFDQNYGWIKQDQEQRKKVKELQDQKYEERKSFYLDLFSGYNIKEFYFTQTSFEKRLIEEFKEKGEEICNNNQDDNENQQVDCEESQCGGKICGAGTKTVSEGNSTKELEVDFYCIQSVCQAKEDDIKSEEPVCGNHVCEEGEANTTEKNGTCQADCAFAKCPKFEAIECEGKVIFEGEDEAGCQLPPICIEEKETCEITEDCTQPSCGLSECVKEDSEEQGECKVTTLKECASECESWEQKIERCNNQKIITEICEDGQWKETGSKCESESKLDCVQCGDSCISKEESMAASCLDSAEKLKCEYQNGKCVVSENFPDPTPFPIEPISGVECEMAADCGGEDDVCSNGKCIQIPKVIKDEDEKEDNPIEKEPEEPEEKQNKEHEEPKESKQEEELLSDNMVVGAFQAFLSKLTTTGNIVGAAEADGGDPSESSPEPEEESSPEEEAPHEEDNSQESEGNKECPDAGNPPEKKEGCWYEETFDSEGCVSGYDYFCDENKDDKNEDNYQEDFEDDRDEWEEKDKEERKRHEEENKERCEKDCARPCVEKCIRSTCGDEMSCDIDKESKTCETSCRADDSCIEKCISGEPNWWEEFQDEDMHKQEKGVFQVGGGCRTEQSRTEGHIWFNGWGDPFERIDPLKHQYYSGGEADWCKQDLENLIKQREELEKGFNQEFATWFFEKYLPNSAEDWEQSQSGIYEVYWNSVDMQRQLAERMGCIGEDNISNVMDVNLINIEYETEFGRLEYWEEIKEVKMDWMDEEVTIISPYMKVWIFPSEDFIKYEMKTSMENGEFPGSSEDKAQRKNEEGLTEEEQEIIRQDKDFMELIEDVSEEYDGNADISFQIVDEEEVIFNLYIQLNKENLMEIEPMSPSEQPAEDIKIQLDFEKLYDLINYEEKEMRGAQLESPPWDHRPRHGKIKGMTDGIKMYFKVRSLINSAEVTPSSSKGDAKDLMMSFLKIMGDKDDNRDDKNNKEGEKEFEEEKEGPSITGEVTKPAFKF